MGGRKELHISSSDFRGLLEDHDAYDTQSPLTSKMQGCQSNSHDAQGPTTKKNKKILSSSGEDNKYLKIRELTIQQNQQRLRDLGVKNIVNSLTNSAQSQKIKEKKVKQNTHAGDVDFIPDLSDGIQEDYQQVARSAVSKKQHPRQYVSTMSMNRVANLMKLRRVVAPDVSQKVPSTSNALKLNAHQPTVTPSEISNANKGGAKRSMALVDEDDGEDVEIFEGSRVDMEVDDVDQDDEYEDQDFSKDGDNIHEPLQVPENQKTIASDSKGNNIGRRKRLHITSIISNESIEDHGDDQVFQTQGHQTREIQGAPKKVRGGTQKAETWNMESTERIVVTFNQFGRPIGDEGNELVQFLGTLVRNADHVSIEYSDWRKVPTQNKKDMYSLVKSKFVIHPNETDEIKKWIFYSMGRKWKSWKGSLKERAFDPTLTIDEIVAQQVSIDKRVNPTQFKKLVGCWFTSEFQKTCDYKRLSRSKMKEPHVSGTKSFARLAHEMATKNNGAYPSRGEMYIKTRTRKDGSIVDDKAAHVVASLKKIANDSTITPADPNDFTNDDYSKVKGPENRGYVRLVGRMPTAKSNDIFSTNTQTNDQLKSAVNALAIIIQEHIPNANLSSVLNSLNVQVPVGSLVHNNSSSDNEIPSSRCHIDNGQERYLNN